MMAGRRNGKAPLFPTNTTTGTTGASFSTTATAADQKRGLPNLGNTCYANAFVQAFGSVPLFSEAVQAAADTTTTTPVTTGLAAAFRATAASGSGSPSRAAMLIRSSVQQSFARGQQQDCFEFANLVLNQLEIEASSRLSGGFGGRERSGGSGTITPPTTDAEIDECGAWTTVGSSRHSDDHGTDDGTEDGIDSDGNDFVVVSRATSHQQSDGKAEEESKERTRTGTTAAILEPPMAVDPAAVFRGVACDTRTCRTCRQQTSTHTRPFVTLTLPLPPRRSRMSVTELLTRELQAKAMGEQSFVECAGCGGPQPSESQMEVTTAPPALLLQVERYRLVGTGQSWANVQKRTDGILLEEYITLPRTTTTTTIATTTTTTAAAAAATTATVSYATAATSGHVRYKLTAVVSHIGASARSGHYVADVAVGEDSFVRVNDSVVSEPVGFDELQQQAGRHGELMSTATAYGLV
jgi:ubiquitin C-terminal hydrolase